MGRSSMSASCARIMSTDEKLLYAEAKHDSEKAASASERCIRNAMMAGSKGAKQRKGASTTEDVVEVLCVVGTLSPTTKTLVTEWRQAAREPGRQGPTALTPRR